MQSRSARSVEPVGDVEDDGWVTVYPPVHEPAPPAGRVVFEPGGPFVSCPDQQWRPVAICGPRCKTWQGACRIYRLQNFGPGVFRVDIEALDERSPCASCPHAPAFCEGCEEHQ
jgi:hypothetical protein